MASAQEDDLVISGGSELPDEGKEMPWHVLWKGEEAFLGHCHSPLPSTIHDSTGLMHRFSCLHSIPAGLMHRFSRLHSIPADIMHRFSRLHSIPAGIMDCIRKKVYIVDEFLCL